MRQINFDFFKVGRYTPFPFYMRQLSKVDVLFFLLFKIILCLEGAREGLGKARVLWLGIVS